MDAIKHWSKWDDHDRSRLYMRLHRWQIALEKISGEREYDKRDHELAATYRPEKGKWTTDEYLADDALART